MMLGAKRAKYFSPIDHWGPVLQTPGVTFVNLQYGDCSAEIARAEAMLESKKGSRDDAEALFK